jgi:beta-galactosidase GanA
MSGFKPPYLGAAYYPEAWPLEQVDEDIRLMLEAGLNVVRIGEFAWSSMEPEEGRFELGWLHRVVDKLLAVGIATIMCTPSCTPPAWLTATYPEVIVVNHAGVRAGHGFRRHVCPNNPVYRELCGRITMKLAEAFGRNERVIGWQIDNEVDLWEGWGCYCDVCVPLFREKLREKFGTVEALNAAWGTNVWSQTYPSFAHVPAPKPNYCHHPSLLTAWALFQSESLVDYVAHQAAILHRHVSQPVGTDMMPILSVSYEQMHRNLDLVQYNHYDTMENLWRQVFWMDYVRPFKKAPFWNTETSTCWNGGVTANGYREPGFCRANSWLSIALGGEANLYWLWRSHWSGQELMHGSVVSSCGRPLYIIQEVQEVSAGFKAASEFLNGTRPEPPGMAVHVSTLAHAQLRFQPIVPGFDYVESMLNRVYRPLMGAHLRADVIDPAAPLDDYRLVYSPFLPALDESGLRERLRNWIEEGGTWVVGPFSDIRTLEGAKPTHAPFGCLEEWAGVLCRHELPGEPCDFTLQYSDGRTSHGSLWYAGFELTSAKAIAVYTEGPLEGLAAASETRLGKGRIILLGTMPLAADMRRLMLQFAAQCNIRPAAEASPNVLVVPRKGEAGEGLIVIEIENRPGVLELPTPVRNMLDGNEYTGRLEIAPYQVMVLRAAGSVADSHISKMRRSQHGAPVELG